MLRFLSAGNAIRPRELNTEASPKTAPQSKAKGSSSCTSVRRVLSPSPCLWDITDSPYPDSVAPVLPRFPVRESGARADTEGPAVLDTKALTCSVCLFLWCKCPHPG